MDNFKRFLNKKTPSVEQIAAKHKKDVRYITKQLEAGIKVEMEHTNKKAVATEIALDHLNERPDYYQRLKKVE
jgi:hypothetical protein